MGCPLYSKALKIKTIEMLVHFFFELRYILLNVIYNQIASKNRKCPLFTFGKENEPCYIIKYTTLHLPIPQWLKFITKIKLLCFTLVYLSFILTTKDMTQYTQTIHKSFRGSKIQNMKNIHTILHHTNKNTY